LYLLQNFIHFLGIEKGLRIHDYFPSSFVKFIACLISSMGLRGHSL
jgi:hypothetical protein